MLSFAVNASVNKLTSHTNCTRKHMHIAVKLSRLNQSEHSMRGYS